MSGSGLITKSGAYVQNFTGNVTNFTGSFHDDEGLVSIPSKAGRTLPLGQTITVGTASTEGHFCLGGPLVHYGTITVTKGPICMRGLTGTGSFDVGEEGSLGLYASTAAVFNGTVRGSGLINADQGVGQDLTESLVDFKGNIALALGTLTVGTVLAGNTLTMNGGAYIASGHQSWKKVEGASATAAITLGANNLTVGGGAYSGSLSGTGTLTKESEDVQTFSGNLTGFTGNITLEAGTLTAGAISARDLEINGGTFNISGNQTWQSFNGTNPAGKVNLGGKTLTLTDDGSYRGALAGAGIINKTTGGTQILRDPAGFTGNLTVAAGTAVETGAITKANILTVGGTYTLSGNQTWAQLVGAGDVNLQGNILGTMSSAASPFSGKFISLATGGGVFMIAHTYFNTAKGSRVYAFETLVGDTANHNLYLGYGGGEGFLSFGTPGSLYTNLLSLYIGYTGKGTLNCENGYGYTVPLRIGNEKTNETEGTVNVTGNMVLVSPLELGYNATDGGTGNLTVTGGLITSNTIRVGRVGTFSAGYLAGAGTLDFLQNSLLTLNGTADGDFSGVVKSSTVGNGTLFKEGLAKQTFSGSLANFTGMVTVLAGELLASHATGLTVSSGKTFTMGGASTPGVLTVSSGLLTNNGTITITKGTLNASAGLTGAGPVAVAGTLALAGSATTVSTGSVSGIGRITKAGSGTHTFSGNLAGFAGDILVEAGMLVARAVSGNQLTLNGGTYSALGNQTWETIEGTEASAALTLGSNNLTLNKGGGAYGGSLSGTGLITKLGDAAQTFSGELKDFTGDVTVESGTLAVGAVSAKTLTVSEGTYNILGDQTWNTFQGANPAGRVDVGGKTLTLQGDGSYEGAFVGGGTVHKTTEGTQILRNPAGFTGNLTVDAGTVVETGAITKANVLTVGGTYTLSGNQEWAQLVGAGDVNIQGNTLITMATEDSPFAGKIMSPATSGTFALIGHTYLNTKEGSSVYYFDRSAYSAAYSFVLGYGGGEGFLSIGGGCQNYNAGTFRVGHTGKGTLNFLKGLTYVGTAFHIGDDSSAASVGIVNVTGTATVGAALALGYNGTAGGIGSLLVSGGLTVSSTLNIGRVGTFSAGSLAGTGTFAFLQDSTLTLDGIANGNFSGTFSSAASDYGMIIKNGASAQTLSGALLNFAGSMTVSEEGGAMTVAAVARPVAPANILTVYSSYTMTGPQYWKGINGAGTLALGSNNLTILGAGGVYLGDVSGDGVITMDDAAGVQTLQGIADFTGDVKVLSGKLITGAAPTLRSLTVDGTYMLSGNQAVYDLSGSGTIIRDGHKLTILGSNSFTGKYCTPDGRPEFLYVPDPDGYPLTASEAYTYVMGPGELTMNTYTLTLMEGSETESFDGMLNGASGKMTFWEGDHTFKTQPGSTLGAVEFADKTSPELEGFSKEVKLHIGTDAAEGYLKVNAVSGEGLVNIGEKGTYELGGNQTISVLEGSGTLDLKGYSLTTKTTSLSPFAGKITSSGGRLTLTEDIYLNTTEGSSIYVLSRVVMGPTLYLGYDGGDGFLSITVKDTDTYFGNGAFRVGHTGKGTLNFVNGLRYTGTAFHIGNESTAASVGIVNVTGTMSVATNPVHLGYNGTSGGTGSLNVSEGLTVSSALNIGRVGTFSAGSLAGTGTLDFKQDSTLTLNGTADGDFSGTLNSAEAGYGTLIKNGSAAQTLRGPLTNFTGNITVAENGGSLTVAAVGQHDAPAHILTLGSSSAYTLTGAQYWKGIDGAGTLTLLEGKSLTIFEEGGDFSGNLLGAGLLSKEGEGEQVLSGRVNIKKVQIINGALTLKADFTETKDVVVLGPGTLNVHGNLETFVTMKETAPVLGIYADGVKAAIHVEAEQALWQIYGTRAMNVDLVLQKDLGIVMQLDALEAGKSLTLKGDVSGTGNLSLSGGGELKLQGLRAKNWKGTLRLEDGHVLVSDQTILGRETSFFVAQDQVLDFVSTQEIQTLTGQGRVTFADQTLTLHLQSASSIATPLVANAKSSLAVFGNVAFEAGTLADFHGKLEVKENGVLEIPSDMSDDARFHIWKNSKILVPQNLTLTGLKGEGLLKGESPDDALLSLTLHEAGAQIFSGDIQGFKLTLQGEQTFRWDGSNEAKAHTEGIVVGNAAVLVLGEGALLNAAETLTLERGGTVDVRGNQAIAGLSGEGVLKLGGRSFDLTLSEENNRFDGILQGKGTLYLKTTASVEHAIFYLNGENVKNFSGQIIPAENVTLLGIDGNPLPAPGVFVSNETKTLSADTEATEDLLDAGIRLNEKTLTWKTSEESTFNYSLEGPGTVSVQAKGTGSLTLGGAMTHVDVDVDGKLVLAPSANVTNTTFRLFDWDISEGNATYLDIYQPQSLDENSKIVASTGKPVLMLREGGELKANIDVAKALRLDIRKDITFSGTIAGTGLIQKAGAGALLLATPVTSKMNWEIEAGSVEGHLEKDSSVLIKNNAQFALSADQTLKDVISEPPSSTLDGRGYALTLSGASVLGGNVRNDGSLNVLQALTLQKNEQNYGTIDLAEGALLTLQGTDQEMCISGFGTVVSPGRVFLNVSGDVSFAGDWKGNSDVIKRGAGTYSVGGNYQNFYGTYTVEDGSVILTGTASFGKSPIRVTQNAVLEIAKENEEDMEQPFIGGDIALMEGTLRINKDWSRSKGITIETGRLEILENTTLSVASLQFTGAKQLTKAGEGRLLLKGALTQAPTLLLQEGTLVLEKEGTLGALEGAGHIQTQNKLTLSLHQNQEFSGTLEGNKTLSLQGTGAWTVTNEQWNAQWTGALDIGPDAQLSVAYATTFEALRGTGTVSMNDNNLKVMVGESQSFKNILLNAATLAFEGKGPTMKTVRLISECGKNAFKKLHVGENLCVQVPFDADWDGVLLEKGSRLVFEKGARFTHLEGEGILEAQKGMTLDTNGQDQRFSGDIVSFSPLTLKGGGSLTLDSTQEGAPALLSATGSWILADSVALHVTEAVQLNPQSSLVLNEPESQVRIESPQTLTSVSGKGQALLQGQTLTLSQSLSQDTVFSGDFSAGNIVLKGAQKWHWGGGRKAFQGTLRLEGKSALFFEAEGELEGTRIVTEPGTTVTFQTSETASVLEGSGTLIHTVPFTFNLLGQTRTFEGDIKGTGAVTLKNGTWHWKGGAKTQSAWILERGTVLNLEDGVSVKEPLTLKIEDEATLALGADQKIATLLGKGTLDGTGHKVTWTLGQAEDFSGTLQNVSLLTLSGSSSCLLPHLTHCSSLVLEKGAKVTVPRTLSAEFENMSLCLKEERTALSLRNDTTFRHLEGLGTVYAGGYVCTLRGGEGEGASVVFGGVFIGGTVLNLESYSAVFKQLPTQKAPPKITLSQASVLEIEESEPKMDIQFQVSEDSTLSFKKPVTFSALLGKGKIKTPELTLEADASELQMFCGRIESPLLILKGGPSSQQILTSDVVAEGTSPKGILKVIDQNVDLRSASVYNPKTILLEGKSTWNFREGVLGADVGFSLADSVRLNVPSDFSLTQTLELCKKTPASSVTLNVAEGEANWKGYVQGMGQLFKTGAGRLRFQAKSSLQQADITLEEGEIMVDAGYTLGKEMSLTLKKGTKMESEETLSLKALKGTGVLKQNGSLAQWTTEGETVLETPIEGGRLEVGAALSKTAAVTLLSQNSLDLLSVLKNVTVVVPPLATIGQNVAFLVEGTLDLKTEVQNLTTLSGGGRIVSTGKLSFDFLGTQGLNLTTSLTASTLAWKGTSVLRMQKAVQADVFEILQGRVLSADKLRDVAQIHVLEGAQLQGFGLLQEVTLRGTLSALGAEAQKKMGEYPWDAFQIQKLIIEEAEGLEHQARLESVIEEGGQSCLKVVHVEGLGHAQINVQISEQARRTEDIVLLESKEPLPSFEDGFTPTLSGAPESSSLTFDTHKVILNPLP
ncbi:hypothetical protein AGMMS49949_01630 [Alphaproteobacteria bacterium]|nr:hypothetical protein AGMMS49949_01630 [Alphaproteobacteria bacterium]